MCYIFVTGAAGIAWKIYVRFHHLLLVSTGLAYNSAALPGSIFVNNFIYAIVDAGSSPSSEY